MADGAGGSRVGHAVLPGWLVRNAAHLFALWGFAVVQPTLGVLSENADLFVARQVQGWSFVSVLVALALVPPLLLAGVEALANLLGERPRSWLHLFLVWGLLALIALYAIEKLFASRALLLLPVAWVIAMGATIVYARHRPTGSFFTVLAPAPLFFVAVFLVFSPSHKLVFPDEATAAEVRSRTPVVMLVLDEIHVGSLMDGNGRIDARLFPHFAELARGSTWFRNTTAAADFTEEAIPALLSGRNPRRGTLPVLPDHPENLFTLLGKSHRLEVMEYISWLCPPSLCPNETPTVQRMTDLASALGVVYGHVILPRRFSSRLPVVGSTWQETRAVRDPKREIDPDTSHAALARRGDAQFERFLGSIRPVSRDAARPPLHLLHSSLPHVPWKHLPSGRVYAKHFDHVPGLVDGGNVWGAERHLVDRALQRHLLQVKYTDLLLGRLFQRLRATGLYDRSLVVVTADHGVSFQPRGERRPVNGSNAGEVGLVPFFVKAPGQRKGRAVDKHLQSTDVLPTMAELLGVRIPWRVDGQPASRLPPGGRGRVRIMRHEGDGNDGEAIPTSLLDRQRRQSIQRKLDLFGEGTGLAGLYGLGPDRDLTGRAVAGLGVERDDAGPAQLEDAAEFASVDPHSRFVPTWVQGTVPNGVERVAIAVNGTVRGTSLTYSVGDATRFSVMVPEDALRAGRNRMEVIAASGAPGDRRLVRLQID